MVILIERGYYRGYKKVHNLLKLGNLDEISLWGKLEAYVGKNLTSYDDLMENIPFFTLSSNTIDRNDLENFIKGQLFLVRKFEALKTAGFFWKS